MKHTPGPLPSSCLTCRQRKRKCDKRQPTCATCLDSGLKCLGYDHIPQPTPPYSFEKSTSLVRPLAPKNPKPSVREVVDLTTDNRLLDQDQVLAPSSNGGSQPKPSVTQSGYRTVLPAPSAVSELPTSSHSLLASPSQPEAQIRSQPSSLLVSQRRPLTIGPLRPSSLEPALPGAADPGISSPRSQSFTNGELAQSTHWLLGTSEGCFDQSVIFSLPPRICPDPVTSGKFIEFILSQYEPLLDLIFFKPTRACRELAQKGMAMRLRSSNLAHWSMYVGARIFQVLMKDGKRADLRYLRSCLRLLDQYICVKSVNDSSIDELANSLSSGLELVFVNFVTSNTQAGYTLLKNLVPTFLQLAFTDIDLWSRQLNPGSGGISFSHALASPVHQLRRFVFCDAIASLTFGTPPLIEYDVSFPPVSPIYPLNLEHEWENGVAPEFMPEFTFLVSKVNVWRAKNPGKLAAESDWKPLEAEAWGYEWNTGREMKMTGEREGWELIARMAILEGWRHAVLIYLYMGMCRFASDDRRVQSSVRQIMLLLKVLRWDWSTRTHFFLPCLMASICTPHEKHRAELSDAFLNVEDTQPWLFKAMDYKPVIDHLWHGAAANGRPVRWEDYVNSRRAMLPID